MANADANDEIDQSQIYKISDQPLSAQYAHSILTKFKPAQQNKTSQTRASLHILFFTTDTNKLKDYPTDNYNWTNDGALKLTPANDPLVYKSLYFFKFHRNPCIPFSFPCSRIPAFDNTKNVDTNNLQAGAITTYRIWKQLWCYFYVKKVFSPNLRIKKKKI